MTKKELSELIKIEIYEPYKKAKGRIRFFDKIWLRYFSPESNAILLVRKKEYFEQKRRGRIFSRLFHAKLVKRYGIHISEGTIIKKGLKIAHPTNIVITKCEIGENFTIYQSCTIGQKSSTGVVKPMIGDNVTMYAGSMIIGNVVVSNGALKEYMNG